MKIEGFLHFNIRCSEADLPAIEKFYGDVMGLKKGPRPNFVGPGIWLYDGKEPILHVGARKDIRCVLRDFALPVGVLGIGARHVDRIAHADQILDLDHRDVGA